MKCRSVGLCAEGKTCVAVAGAASITAGLPWAAGNPVDDQGSATRVMAAFDADNNLQVGHSRAQTRPLDPHDVSRGKKMCAG